MGGRFGEACSSLEVIGATQKEIPRVSFVCEVIGATQSYTASEYGKWQVEYINGTNEECWKQQESFKHASSSKLSEAARAFVAACGDWIRLYEVDDSHLMALGAAMKGRPLRSVAVAYGRFGDAGVQAIAESIDKTSYLLFYRGEFTEAGVVDLRRVANASGLTVKTARPGYFCAGQGCWD